MADERKPTELGAAADEPATGQTAQVAGADVSRIEEVISAATAALPEAGEDGARKPLGQILK